MKVEAAFVRSVADATDWPHDGLPAIVLVGRSNVGKSSIVNALARRQIARTSRTPGKTRLANVYRLTRGAMPSTHFVDLPGYGYARGDDGSFENIVRNAFDGQADVAGALLLADARHPGLENDLRAWEWLQSAADERRLIVTKIDKLARGERIRAVQAFESVFDSPALPVSAVTGEGMDELWKLIDRLTSGRSRKPRNA